LRLLSAGQHLAKVLLRLRPAWLPCLCAPRGIYRAGLHLRGWGIVVDGLLQRLGLRTGRTEEPAAATALGIVSATATATAVASYPCRVCPHRDAHRITFSTRGWTAAQSVSLVNASRSRTFSSMRCWNCAGSKLPPPPRRPPGLRHHLGLNCCCLRQKRARAQTNSGGDPADSQDFTTFIATNLLLQLHMLFLVHVESIAGRSP
jgi:hypothetical protein